jgi:mono/diheme cytochrome c family protein
VGPALWLLACAPCDGARAQEIDVPATDPVLAGMGAEIYQRHCASCHGVTGTGDGPAAGDLQPPPTDLTRIAERHGGDFAAGEVSRFIDGRFDVPAHGSRDMPVWGERFGQRIPEAGVSEEVTRGKIATLIEYLKSIQRGD